MKHRLCLIALSALLLPCAAQFCLVSGQSSVSSASPPSLSDDEAFAGYQRVTAGITPPKATHSPDPEYPQLPPDTEPQGVVVMLIGVDAHGRVQPVRALRSSGPAFEKSAVATVKTWRFKPAKQNGKAVPVQITVEMNFAK